MSSKDLTEALRALTEQANNRPSVQDAMNARGATGRSVASALLDGGGNGGGIASPLTETNYADRTWHPERTITSTDGVWALKIKPLKSIKFNDAVAAEVVFNLKDRP